MSANRIKAGEAAVSISTQDNTKPGIDRVQQNFSALSKSIRKQSESTQKITAAAAVTAGRDAIVEQQKQFKMLEGAAKNAERRANRLYKAYTSPGNKSVKIEDVQGARQDTDFWKAKADQGLAKLEQLKKLQAELEQSADVAAAKQQRRDDLRIIRARELAAAMAKQNTIAGTNAAAGSGAVRAAMASGTNQHKITTLASTAEADKLTRSLSQQNGLVNTQVSALMSQLRTMRASGAASAAQAPVMQTIRDLIAQRRELEQQINQITGVRSGLESKELAAEQQIAAEKTKQLSAEQQAARLEQIRAAQADARARAERDAAGAQKAATASGNEQVRLALSQAAAQQRITSLGSTKEADRLTASYVSQRDTLNSQIPALMSQLRTMRASGAASAAQAPVMQTIRDLIAQRRELEQQINQIAGVRSGLEAKELATEQRITAEKQKQEHLDRINANKAAQDAITAPKRNRAGWNDNGGVNWGNTQGLSTATMYKYAKSVKNVQFDSDGASIASARFARSLGGVGGGAGKAQMALQQMIFAVDDATTSYGIGGLAGAVRGAANNVTMAASVIGGPWALAAAVAATATAQLYLTFNKTADSADKFTDALDRQTDSIKRMIDFRRELAELEFQGDSKQSGKALENRHHDSEILSRQKKLVSQEIDEWASKINDHRDRTWAEFTDAWTLDWVAQLWGGRGVFESTRDSTFLQKQKKEAKGRLTGKDSLQERYQRLDREHTQVTSEISDLEKTHNNKVKNEDRIKWQKAQLEQQEKQRKKLVDQIRYQKELNDLVRSNRMELMKIADPRSFQKLEVMQEDVENRKRLKFLRQFDSITDADMSRQNSLISVATLKKLHDLDQSDPLKRMGRDIEGEMNDKQGQRRRILDQAQERLFELQQQATLNPGQAKQIQQLRGGAVRSMAKQMLALDSTRQNQPNTATEANTTEGMRAVIAATSRDNNSPMQKIWQGIMNGNQLSEDQKRLWEDFMKETKKGPVLVVKRVN